MVLRWIYFFKILLLYNCEICIHHLTYKAPTDVIANCSGKDFTVNTTQHRVEWGTFVGLFPAKPPYFYLKNGSLLIKGVSEDSSHYLCEVKDKFTNASLHRCGTSVTIIKPLVIKFRPVNETVEKGFMYKINCHGGGGDYSDWKLSYLVNDVEISDGNSEIKIDSDTKIECRLVSGGEKLSSIAFIKVKKDGFLTDEEKLLHVRCAVLSDGICYKKFPEKSYRVYPTYPSGRLIVENMLRELFQSLDEKILPEHNEDRCVDRFQRLVCSIMYKPCHNFDQNKYIEEPICRESCDVTLETVCRNTIQRIKKVFDSVITNYVVSNVRSWDDTVTAYTGDYINRVGDLVKSVFNCSLLLPFRNKSKAYNCSLLNLDVIQGSRLQFEPPSKKCYNQVGRNFTGDITEKPEVTKCIDWSRVPLLYTAFYQQNLQNQSSYCRNPGGILEKPMCLTTPIKTTGELSLRDVYMTPCTQIYTCKYYLLLEKSSIEKGSISISIIAGIIFVLLVVTIVAISFKCMNKKFKRTKTKLIHANEIPLNETQIQLFDNKNYMYKNVQNGHYSCPIYNSACLERVFKVSDGAYGEILLVQAVFEDSTQLTVDESAFRSTEKSTFVGKSGANDPDDNIIDDFILSKDKTFNGKPCWPFDKSSESGCCQFAIIKYSIRSSEPLMESRFSQETKILSLLNHPNIMRFYGVTVNNTGKVISRIIEYLPNGTLYSILIGERPKPLTTTNHNRGKLENGYQAMSALQKYRLKENNNSLSTNESKTLKRKKTNSSQSREPELPKPAEYIDLSIKQLVKWILDICDAVTYLHHKHYLHRDIATRNCLVGSHLETKLSDFNFVQKFTIGHDLIGSNHEFIPIRWLPKETLENLIFNIDTDVWMFGIFMWEVMSLGKQPYDDLDLNETVEAIISDVHLSIPNNCPDDIYKEMKNCWVDSNSRPCLETISRNLKKILEIL